MCLSLYKIGKAVTTWTYCPQVLDHLQEHKENKLSVQEWIFAWNGKYYKIVASRVLFTCFGMTIIIGWISLDYCGPNGNFVSFKMVG